MKKKILFFLQLPPPVHGASVINMSIRESKLINKMFSAYFVDISSARKVDDIGKFDFKKIVSVIVIFYYALTSFKRLKPDLIYLTLSPHGIALYKDGILAILIKLMGGKIIFHLHGKGIKSEAGRSKIKAFFYRLVFKNADVIHLSTSLYEDIDGVRDRSKNIYAVANGISPLVTDSVGGPKKPLRFIYLSSLIRSKGADVLVKAAAILSKKYKGQFYIKIIGKARDKNYLAEIEEVIKNNSLINISMLGPLYGAEKIRELFDSQVFVLPTKNDCFPVSILEAMSAGLSVISTDEGAITDIITDGVNGNIIKKLSPESLARVMEIYILDPVYAKNCSKRNIEKFRDEYTSEAFERSLCRVLEKSI